MRLKFGSNIPHTLILPSTMQQAPMKLKLSEGVYNRMRCAMGQLLAPRAFGSKKYVVPAFVVSEPDIRTTGHFFFFGPENL